MKILQFTFCKACVLSLMILVLIQCGKGTSEQSEYRTPNGAPSNGVELIEIVVEKSSLRFSLNEDDQKAIREILRETYIEKYGDPNESVAPQKVREMKREIFIESSERINEYMETDKEKE